MKIIADSGSTKTHWSVFTNSGQRSDYYTSGINPSLMSDDDVNRVVSVELLPQLSSIWWVGPFESVEFYGAGCAGAEPIERVKKALRTAFKHADIIVDSDMVGACRALLGGGAGVCAILGTGSNSCYYDGARIADNVPSLGFILGDEGGGAYIGKRLVGDILKGQMPESVCRAFEDEYHLTVADIVHKVYREPAPNRFLAQLTHFAAMHIGVPEVEALVIDCFEQFVVRNLLHYRQPAGSEVHFVGSVAFFFRTQLSIALQRHKLRLGKVLREPLDIDDESEV
ncbi:MAG: ATPase [Paludibacteraceae bacterium]|nr:ATPase [Paludibacteraceae bacterium]